MLIMSFEFISENQLNLLNDPEMSPTFTKQSIEQNSNEVHTRESYIDLTK